MKIGIMGQGRIGRALVRQFVASSHAVVAVSDPRLDPDADAYLLRNDSVHGRWGVPVAADSSNDALVVGSRRIQWLRGARANLWSAAGAEVLVDCTGAEETVLQARQRKLPAGVEYLIATRNSPALLPPFVVGANDTELPLPQPGATVATGSCTAHCLLPVLRVLLDRGFAVRSGSVTVLHPYLPGQNLLDNPNASCDLSLLRAAPLSVIPARTGLLSALEAVFPSLQGRFDAVCYRVPVPAVLTMDVSLEFTRRVHGQDLLQALSHAAAGTHHGILTVVDEALVSSDLVHSTWSAAVRGGGEGSAAGTRHRLTLFQDNEWGFSRRVVDLMDKLAAQRRSAA